MPIPASRPAAFLDRDGVLNHDVGYAHRAGQIIWVQGASTAVRRLNNAGFLVFSRHQPGRHRALASTTARMSSDCTPGWPAASPKAGARIDDWRYCPYHPEAPARAFRGLAGWRKPAPGMLLDLMAHWPVRREGIIPHR